MNSYTFMVFQNVYKGNKFCDFLLASLDNKVLPEWGLLLKERIFSTGELSSIQKKGSMKMAELLPLNTQIHLYFKTTGNVLYALNIL